MRFERLDINPAHTPAVLATATWDPAAAWSTVQTIDDHYWGDLWSAAISSAAQWPLLAQFTPCPVAAAFYAGTLYFPARLADGQQIFLGLGPVPDDALLGDPVGAKPLNSPLAATLALYPTDAAVIDRFCRLLVPERGPRALGAVPRLGIGTRMTTAVWPAIWQAMAEGGFAANAIQNSVRELNFLATLLACDPPEQNIAFGFGAIETGYTGSSFEGLWVAGVLAALAAEQPTQALRYGADADHIQVKRGPEGLARATRMLDATRYYSFFTLDVSDVLEYSALAANEAAAVAYLTGRIADEARRNEFLACHRQVRRPGGSDYSPDVATLGRLTGKYWTALDAVETMYAYIRDLKAGVPFDLELSIDEHPNDVPTFECLTSETELSFVLLEAQRRGIPLTHVAPNFGVEKGTDYRGSDGLAGFEARVRTLCRITEAFGVMPDFHSGDDLSAATRQAIGRATAGRNHFKVSPNLQLLFGEVLAGHHPALFRRWYTDALAYATREAAAGSTFAAGCLRVSKPSAVEDLSLLAHDAVFHHFSFAFVGRRDADGQFLCREAFYTLSPAFYRAYQARIVAYLKELAADLRLGNVA